MVPMRLMAALACALVPAAAEAQWAFSGYTGTSHTQPSTLTVYRPDVGQSLEFLDVKYEARPFKAAPYYGVRVTRFFSHARRLGLEFELLHNKVYARTADFVPVRGTLGGAPINLPLRMNTYVERYNHSHGLSFLLANVVWRQPLGGGSQPRLALNVRGGAGPVISGRDIVMSGLNVQGYELSGLGAHASAGLTARIAGAVSLMAEYKLTYARPEITLTGGGHSRMTAVSHHIAAGLTITR